MENEMDGLVLERIVVNFDDERVLEAEVSDPPIFKNAKVQVKGLTDRDHGVLVKQILGIAGGSHTGEGTLERQGERVLFNGNDLKASEATMFHEMLYLFHPLLQI